MENLNPVPVQEKSVLSKEIYGLVGAILLGLIVWFFSAGLSPQGRMALSLTMAAIVMWVFEVYPVEITAVLLSTFFVFMGAANPVDAFSGYGDSIVWFIFAALVFGTAVEQSGIGKRIACTLMRFSGSSFKSMMAIIVVVGALLSFLTPAGVERLLIIYPIALGVAAVFVKGTVKGTNTGKLAMAITYLAGNTFGFGILTGIAVNILGVGIIKQILGIDVYWSQWITWFGVPIVITTLISIFVAWKIFPPEDYVLQSREQDASKEFSNLGPITGVEKRALLYLLIILGLWATDRWHHLPSWGVAIFSAALFCGPGFGVITKEQLKKIQFSIVIFSGAAITIGTVLGKTGVATWMGKALLGTFIKPDMSPQAMGAVTYLVGAVAHIPLVESKTAAAAFTPAVAAYFKSLGVPALGPSLMSIISADTVAFFPYMMMPFLALMGLGYFSTKDSIKLLSSYTAVAICVQVLSCFTWYHWIGLL
ncbi:transporter [Desulfosporosinus fructosivorans]|uniref:Transporter n=1 Tax=Desulfosporosinus fructosivorans TaxID=2018669 RepID=A0A4Z0R7F7_9FIRM|nr:SLC13 family permease [Desulfosporosinus fructosivorans]TGE39111.1 transporter [Desulfosporosinus fructosivorans]